MTKKVTVEKSNKLFWAKSKSEQRISVAKDVLKSINSGFYKAETGTYFLINDLNEGIEYPDKQLQDSLEKIRKANGSCEVCGIGACFTSLVRIGNKAKTDDFIWGGIENYASIGDMNMRPLLKKVFSPKQLSLIECAFEQDAIFYEGDETTSNERDKAAAFGCAYEDDKERLIGIMKNVIKNDGIFIP